jgi:GntR family transcriptional repressor for pyruvate dehydrogenase complex
MNHLREVVDQWYNHQTIGTWWEQPKIPWAWFSDLVSKPMTGSVRRTTIQEVPDTSLLREVSLSMYQAVRTARLFEQIVEQIEGSIREGKLKPGDQLPAERDLAQQFGVSRTAVREAVKTLCEKGLVEAYSGRGTFVTSGKSQSARHSLHWLVNRGDRQDARYVTELREILEPEFTALAAARIEEQQLVMMREAIEVMDHSMQDPDAYIEADLDFHLALAEAAANPLILALLDSIVAILREERLGVFRVPGGPTRGQIHHKLILKAIERRNPAKARKAMIAHMRQIHDDTAKARALKSKSRKARTS